MADPLSMDMRPGRATRSTLVAIACFGALLAAPVALAGDLSNTATATATTATGGVTVRSSSAVTVRLAAPQREIAATCTPRLLDADGVAGASLGDAIALDIALTASRSVLETVAVDLPGASRIGLQFGDADGDRTIDPGETWTFLVERPLVQADFDNGSAASTVVVTALHTPPVTLACPLPIEQRRDLTIVKVADASRLAVDGTVAYRIVATNTGNVVLSGVRIDDPLLTPASRLCDPIPVGGACELVGTLAPTDAHYAANRLANTATAIGGGVSIRTATMEVPLYDPSALRIAKRALTGRVRRGGTVRFEVSLTSIAPIVVPGLSLIDRLPAGLALQGGSVTLDGEPVETAGAGRAVTVGPIRVSPGVERRLVLAATVTADAVPGTLVNRVELTDGGGRVVARAEAEIEVESEPVFDCSEILGRVFEDANRNGIMDRGERGLGGARVATARGLVITTDRVGRYAIPCAATPDTRIGSNFVAKLDMRSVPAGFVETTENPRTVRLSAGKASRLDFGVIGRRRIDVVLEADAFARGDTRLAPTMDADVGRLLDVLGEAPSRLRLTYRGSTRERALALRRLEAAAEEIARRWRASGRREPLDVETRFVPG